MLTGIYSVKTAVPSASILKTIIFLVTKGEIKLDKPDAKVELKSYLDFCVFLT